MPVPHNASLDIAAFRIGISQSRVDDMIRLVRLSRLPPQTYEGSDPAFGITWKWMAEAKHHWERFDWRRHEKELNEVPHYVADVASKDGESFRIHFVGIFSDDPNAQALVLLHGWPGSFIEYLPLLSLLQRSTAPKFNIIVPSLPGYLFSSPPPLSEDFSLYDVAFLLNSLMIGLSFGTQHGGYLAQGGDIGSLVARILALEYDDCKGIYLNLDFSKYTESPDVFVDPEERDGIAQGQKFRTTGAAYALEHATRPSTISRVVSSSPLALLAWIGEKLLDWTDEKPSLDFILKNVSLWWLTDTFPTSIYPYREIGSPHFKVPEAPILKPLGFSWFPKDINPLPRALIEKTGVLIYFKRYEKGGHFPAFEQPEGLAEDIIAFSRLRCDTK